MRQYQQIYRAHSSSTNDLTSYDYHAQRNSYIIWLFIRDSIITFLANPTYNSTLVPTPGQYFDDQAYENYRQHYARMSAANYQQQQNEQQLLLLSLGKNTKQIFSRFLRVF